MKNNPDFMWDFYAIKPVSDNLRTGEKLYLPTVKTTEYGLKSLIFHGILLWNNLPISIKIRQTLTDFKKKVFRKNSLYMCSMPLIICH